MDYCAECQKAIDDALSKIPIKFGGRFMEITPTDELLALFKQVKDEQDEEERLASKSGNGLPIVRAIPFSSFIGGDHDNVDTCTYKGRVFRIEWDDDKPDEKHVWVQMEYDFIEKKFTDKYWGVDNKDTYIHSRPPRAKEFIPVKPMSPPIGKLQYMDFDWEIARSQNSKPYVPPHEKIGYTRTYDGATIKRMFEDSINRHETKLLVQQPAILYPFMDYTVEYEKYRDEDFETVTNIKLNGLL